MKVLMVNRPLTWVGGDQIQLEATADNLRKLGVEVDIKENWGYGWSFYGKRYDIIHAFNFNMPWNEWLKEKKYSCKYVCSTIYQPDQKYFDTKTLQKMYDNLDAVILLHKGEEKRLTVDGIKINNKKHYCISNGIEDYWYGQPEMALGNHRKYVLTVGRLSEHKGQANVGFVCHKLGIPYVSVGGQTREQNQYYMIFPDVSREKLKQFYADCICFVLVSKNELMPMTVMEAGMQAKNIILTDDCDWDLPHIDKVKFGDIVGLENAIKRAIKKPPNYPLQSLLKKMTWENTAKQVLDVYKEVLCQ